MSRNTLLAIYGKSASIGISATVRSNRNESSRELGKDSKLGRGLQMLPGSVVGLVRMASLSGSSVGKTNGALPRSWRKLFSVRNRTHCRRCDLSLLIATNLLTTFEGDGMTWCLCKGASQAMTLASWQSVDDQMSPDKNQGAWEEQAVMCVLPFAECVVVDLVLDRSVFVCRPKSDRRLIDRFPYDDTTDLSQQSYTQTCIPNDGHNETLLNKTSVLANENPDERCTRVHSLQLKSRIRSL